MYGKGHHHVARGAGAAGALAATGAHIAVTALVGAALVIGGILLVRRFGAR